MEDSCVLFFKGTFLLDIETRKYLFSPQLFSWQKPDKTFFSEIDKKQDGERIYKTYLLGHFEKMHLVFESEGLNGREKIFRKTVC